MAIDFVGIAWPPGTPTGRKDQTASLVCDDGNGKEVSTGRNWTTYTDFLPGEISSTSPTRCSCCRGVDMPRPAFTDLYGKLYL